MALPCTRPSSRSASPTMSSSETVMSQFTTPPEIPTLLSLETFNHKSTANVDIAGSDKTNERLTVLGERILCAVAMQSVFLRQPPVPAERMEVSCHASFALRIYSTHIFALCATHAGGVQEAPIA